MTTCLGVIAEDKLSEFFPAFVVHACLLVHVSRISVEIQLNSANTVFLNVEKL